MRGEAVAASLQIGAQVAVIVNLAVKNGPDGLIFVGDRLVAGVKVDDAQAAHADGAAAVDMETVVVRPAVHNGAGHALDVGKLGRLAAKEKTGNAAHCFYSNVADVRGQDGR